MSAWATSPSSDEQRAADLAEMRMLIRYAMVTRKPVKGRIGR